ncbi:MAG: glycoside hydrolase family 38 C-terminal domain-containing protein, partial [Cyanobacteria bacterium P01_A01_bin.114]
GRRGKGASVSHAPWAIWDKTKETGESIEADLLAAQGKLALSQSATSSPDKLSGMPDTPPRRLSPFALRPLPVWIDELYLELHRGCYTTHADQKQSNRRCEDLLYQAEVFSTIAQLVAGVPYPKVDLENAWKTLLFNQFHDILPGSSIPEVFEDANRDWVVVKQVGKQVLKQALDAIAAQLQIPPPPHPDAQLLLVFNALNWERSEVMTHLVPEFAPGRLKTHWRLYDFEGQTVPIQTRFTVRAERAFCEIMFLATAVPSVGYRGYWLCPDDAKEEDAQAEDVKERAAQSEVSLEDLLPEGQRQDYVLTNQYLQVTVEADTGEIVSLFDKTQQREVFCAPANQLQAFRDQGQYWDAWNIAPDYEDHPLPSAQLKSIAWFDRGPLCQRLRVIRQLGSSEVTQYYVLEAQSPALKIETRVSWSETQVVLKVNFPLTIAADQATYETPFGSISRPTCPQTGPDKAKWEVPALRWADLSEGEFGVSLLTDCKHGFDAKPNQLRLTLLKAPLWPDPNADRGDHHFTYAIYPHAGGWQQTPHHARELNMPMIVMTPDILPKGLPEAAPTPSRYSSDAPAASSFLQVKPSNWILSALKPAEERPDELIVRAYDATGQGGEMTFAFGSAIALADQSAIPVNFLEQPVPLEQAMPSEQAIADQPGAPYKIHTYRLQNI